MKKETKKEIKFCVILIAVLLVLSLVIVVLAKNIFDKPEFKITKTECRNESEVIGEELVDEATTICNMTITQLNFRGEEIGKFCYDDFWARENPCTTSFCRFFDSWGDVSAIVKKEKFSETNLIWKDIIETWEVCEEVEYDKIKIYEELIVKSCWEWKKRGYGELECINWNDGYFKNKTRTIEKQNLTIFWLDKFCECEEFWREKPCPKGYRPTKEDEEGLVFCNAPYVDSACQKYFCGDYTIEVLG